MLRFMEKNGKDKRGDLRKKQKVFSINKQLIKKILQKRHESGIIRIRIIVFKILCEILYFIRCFYRVNSNSNSLKEN